MDTNEDNAAEESIEKGDEPTFDWWSDEGARIFNDALDEGSAYMLAHPGSCADFEEYLDDDPCEGPHPDLCDPDEEALSPGELKTILENCFIM
jgi:hypothetical protein